MQEEDNLHDCVHFEFFNIFFRTLSRAISKRFLCASVFIHPIFSALIFISRTEIFLHSPSSSLSPPPSNNHAKAHHIFFSVFLRSISLSLFLFPKPLSLNGPSAKGTDGGVLHIPRNATNFAFHNSRTHSSHPSRIKRRVAIQPFI
jgi:hypothetical protein